MVIMGIISQTTRPPPLSLVPIALAAGGGFAGEAGGFEAAADAGVVGGGDVDRDWHETGDDAAQELGQDALAAVARQDASVADLKGLVLAPEAVGLVLLHEDHTDDPIVLGRDPAFAGAGAVADDAIERLLVLQ